ncbi:hypothetical protein [Bradyrhizobium sp. Tv2a-2]|uniref:hypothetical protein n=1 Tax=Bradyrhizobium sp. Tv2a-2 TaxID=113395 RepID=UPI0004653E2D|nr:hypothetical protein [Bradyrhizobium sp. Tv2a-2]
MIQRTIIGANYSLISVRRRMQQSGSHAELKDKKPPTLTRAGGKSLWRVLLLFERQAFSKNEATKPAIAAMGVCFQARNGPTIIGCWLLVRHRSGANASRPTQDVVDTAMIFVTLTNAIWTCANCQMDEEEKPTEVRRLRWTPAA